MGALDEQTSAAFRDAGIRISGPDDGSPAELDPAVAKLIVDQICDILNLDGGPGVVYSEVIALVGALHRERDGWKAEVERLKAEVEEQRCLLERACDLGERACAAAIRSAAKEHAESRDALGNAVCTGGNAFSRAEAAAKEQADEK